MRQNSHDDACVDRLASRLRVGTTARHMIEGSADRRDNTRVCGCGRNFTAGPSRSFALSTIRSRGSRETFKAGRCPQPPFLRPVPQRSTRAARVDIAHVTAPLGGRGCGCVWRRHGLPSSRNRFQQRPHSLLRRKNTSPPNWDSIGALLLSCALDPRPRTQRPRVLTRRCSAASARYPASSSFSSM